MSRIESNAIAGAIWLIDLQNYYNEEQREYRGLPQKAAITDEEREFIQNFDPVIYFNDLTCVHWCFDEKLPSGRYLENIRVEWKNGAIFKAVIVC